MSASRAYSFLRVPFPTNAETRRWFVRVAPFAVFVAALAAGRWLDANPIEGFDARWMYPIRAGLAGLLLIAYWPDYAELRRPLGLTARHWTLALGLGLGVFWCWIHLDFGWFSLGGGPGFDPTDASGRPDPVLLTLRLLGAVVVVPVMEELFWRSFLMRWIDRTAFLDVPATAISVKAIVLSSVVFGLEHDLWFVGIVAGLVYGWMYQRSGNLWVPVFAHAATNAALGAWVVVTGNWKFW